MWPSCTVAEWHHDPSYATTEQQHETCYAVSMRHITDFKEKITSNAMAEGGGDFGYDDHGFDWKIDHDDDEEEVDTTRPFQLGVHILPRW